MANQTLNAISGIATVRRAPLDFPWAVMSLLPPAPNAPIGGMVAIIKAYLLMRRVLLAAPLAAVLFASPSPAAAQPWVVAPASDGAEVISQLFWFTLVLAAIVFVLVEGLLIYSSLRFRRRSPLPLVEPPQIHGNTRLEVMWAAVPALILVGLFGITVSRLGDLSQLPTDPEHAAHQRHRPGSSRGSSATAHSGVTSTNELHIPVGTPLVIFDVTSVDVIHSFWVPDLYGKIDAESRAHQSHHLQGQAAGRISRGVR